MPSLAELQRALCAELLDADRPGVQPALAELVVPAGLSAAQRLAVYRNNTLASLSRALGETFPVIRRLVGEDFFAAAARAFVRRTPPREPRLSHYGADFAAFLGDFPPARSLVYLPDVAHLEWAINEAFYAPDADVLDAIHLGGLDPERAAALRLRLHPSCRLLRSPYPVERIWRANQPDVDGTETIDLREGGCRLLIHRRDLDIRFVALSEGGLALLSAIARSATLEIAYSAAIAVEPAFDLAAALHQLFAATVFAEMEIGGREDARGHRSRPAG